MTVSYVPLAPGSFSFDLTLNNNDADESNFVLHFFGQAINRAPIADAGDDQSVASGASVVLSASQSIDPDGSSLTFAWEQISGPSVVITNPTSEFASILAPDVATTTDLLFRLTVSDGTDGTTDQTQISVSPVPLPEIEIQSDTNATITDGGTVTISPNPDSDGTPAREILTIKNTGTADLNLLSILVQTLTNVSLSDLVLGQEVLTPGQSTTLAIDYTVASRGVFAIELDLVSNDDDESTFDIRLEGISNNQTPVASAGSDQAAIEGEVVRLSARWSSDGDGDPLQFSWQQIEGPTVALIGSATENPYFTAPTVFETTRLTFRVTVSDGTSTASADVSVAVAVSSERAHLAVARSLSSVVNRHMQRSGAGLVSSRSMDRLSAGSFQQRRQPDRLVSNLDEIDDLLFPMDLASPGELWVHVTSDDVLKDLKHDRSQQMSAKLQGIGSDYRVDFDPIDNLLGSQKTGLDTYTAFGVGRYNRISGEGYSGLGGYATVGADYLFDDTLLLGASFTAEASALAFESEINGELRKTGSRLDVYSSFFYDDVFYVEALIEAGGYSNHVESNKAKGDTNSKRLGVSARFGLDYDFDHIALSPWGQLAYMREEFDAYVASDGTQINGFHLKSASGALGMDLRSSQALWGIVQPYATLGLDIDLVPSSKILLADGSAFGTPTLDGRATWGARIQMISSKQSQLYADINLDQQGDFQGSGASGLNVKVGITW